MFDIHNVLASLAQRRPVFQSLRDFRSALATHIRETYPDATLHEQYALDGDSRTSLDLLLTLHGVSYAIELLYRTHKEEHHGLKQHGAQDLARYDFLRSVETLEGIQAERAHLTGIAVLLTNDHLYWTRGRDATFDAAFRLWEGRIIHGPLAWDERASTGTTAGREPPLHIHGIYTMHWHDYSLIHDAAGGMFRYLAVHAVDRGDAPARAPFTKDDALWRLVGSGHGEHSDAISADKYPALADAYAERGG